MADSELAGVNSNAQGRANGKFLSVRTTSSLAHCSSSVITLLMKTSKSDSDRSGVSSDACCIFGNCHQAPRLAPAAVGPCKGDTGRSPRPRNEYSCSRAYPLARNA